MSLCVAISFSPPDVREEDIDAVVEVLRSGWITTGPVGRQFEQDLAQYSGVNEVVLLNSCTAALELALRVLQVGPGDEVIVPAYTYSASAAVIAHVGADIVMVDVAPEEYVPAIDEIVAAVTPRTKAIIVVDIGGVPFDAASLRERLEGTGVDADGNPLLDALDRPVVITDGAHSLGAIRDGVRAGGLGDFTAFSFHAVKNLTTAEGGALTWRSDLPVDQSALTATVRRLSLHGQTKDALSKMKAGAWEYDILEPGFKANMPDVLAALGVSQLRRYPEAVARRQAIIRRYTELLGDAFAVLVHEGKGFASSGHLQLVDLGEWRPRREEIIAGLAERGVAANVHYKPLPLLTAYRDLGFEAADYPHALRQFKGVLSLPLHTLLTDDDVDTVATALLSVVRALPSVR